MTYSKHRFVEKCRITTFFLLKKAIWLICIYFIYWKLKADLSGYVVLYGKYSFSVLTVFFLCFLEPCERLQCKDNLYSTGVYCTRRYLPVWANARSGPKIFGLSSPIFLRATQMLSGDRLRNPGGPYEPLKISKTIRRPPEFYPGVHLESGTPLVPPASRYWGSFCASGNHWKFQWTQESFNVPEIEMNSLCLA